VRNHTCTSTQSCINNQLSDTGSGEPSSLRYVFVFVAGLLMIKNKILINNGGQYKQQTEICQKLYSKK
jgi:hypothetical protein